jgi:hypothetical protein
VRIVSTRILVISFSLFSRIFPEVYDGVGCAVLEPRFAFYSDYKTETDYQKRNKRKRQRESDREKDHVGSNPASMKPCAHCLRCAVPFPFVLLGLLLLTDTRATGTFSFLLLNSGSGSCVRWRWWW